METSGFINTTQSYKQKSFAVPSRLYKLGKLVIVKEGAQKKYLYDS